VANGATVVVHPLSNDSDGNDQTLTADIPSIATATTGFTATYEPNGDTLSITGVKIWMITEADRSSTCILLPEEY